MLDFVASQFKDRLPDGDIGDATHCVIATLLFEGGGLLLRLF